MDNLKNSGHSNQEPSQCSGCDAFPDDILMLACGHDLCLNCAALIYTNEHPNSQQNYITCTICGDTTNLDHSSIYELEKIAMSLKIDNDEIQQQQNQINNQLEQSPDNDISTSLQQSFGKKSINLTQITESQNKNTNQKSFRSKSNKRSVHSQNRNESYLNSEFKQQQQPSPFQTYSNNNNNFNNQNISINTQLQNQQQITKIIKGFCPEHEDEEISYYCFDCLSNCICSECVIHGSHKNHNVKTIKKAFPIINEKLNELSLQIDSKQGEVQKKKSHFDYQQKELNEQTTLLKQQISSLFQNLYRKLESKEKQILDTCQNIYQENTEQINNQINSLNSKLEDLHKTQQYILDNSSQNQQNITQNNKFNTSNISDNSFLNNFNNQEVNILNFYSQNQNSLQDIIKRDVYETKLLNQQFSINQLNLKEIELHMIDIEVEINKISVTFKTDADTKRSEQQMSRQRSKNNSFYSNNNYQSNNDTTNNKQQQIHQEYKQKFKNYFQQQNDIQNDINYQDEVYHESQNKFQQKIQNNDLQRRKISQDIDQNIAPPTFNTQKRYSFLTSKLKEQYEQKLNNSVNKIQQEQEQIQQQQKFNQSTQDFTHNNNNLNNPYKNNQRLNQYTQKENISNQKEEPFNNLLNKFQHYNNKINNRSINTNNLM